MGEKQNEPFQFTFNGFLKVAFQGSRVTSDAGLILVRELDERLGLENLIAEHLSDSQQGLNTQFRLADLLWQSVYSRLAGYRTSTTRHASRRTPRFASSGRRTESWTKARRVVAKVEHHAGELFPRIGFIVTDLQLPNRAVVRFYNKCGTAEQWIKEGKQAAHWTRLSCHGFRANEVRLQLTMLAYNLGNLWRRLVLPKRIDS